MSKSYSELEKLPAGSYLNPDNFTTRFDHPAGQGRAKEQYEEGFKTSCEAVYIYLDHRGVWGAKLKNGASLTSYEGIGYHSNTSHLLRGFLDGPAPIKVYRRREDGTLTTTWIKGEEPK